MLSHYKLVFTFQIDILDVRRKLKKAATSGIQNLKLLSSVFMGVCEMAMVMLKVYFVQCVNRLQKFRSLSERVWLCWAWEFSTSGTFFIPDVASRTCQICDFCVLLHARPNVWDCCVVSCYVACI
jgi:hypothetical protein